MVAFMRPFTNEVSKMNNELNAFKNYFEKISNILKSLAKKICE